MNALGIQKGILARVSGFIAVPICAIGLDYAINTWQEKIDRISAYLMFLNEWFGHLFKCLADFLFDGGFSLGFSVACYRTIFRFPTSFMGDKFFATMNTRIHPLSGCSTFPTANSIAVSLPTGYGEYLAAGWACLFDRVKSLLTGTRAEATSKWIGCLRGRQIERAPAIFTDESLSSPRLFLRSKFNLIISHWHDAIISYLDYHDNEVGRCLN